MRSDLAIAVDLGGTAIKHGIVDAAGNILEKDQVPTGDLAFEAVAERLAAVILERRERLAQDGAAPVGVGVGVPGGIYRDRKVVSQSPNFPAWRDVPMQPVLAQRTGLPVLIENDANLAALGEHWVGAGKGSDSLVAMTLGTGIGGGVILNGRIWIGDDGMAGEVGWITVFPDEPSGLGNDGRGALEKVASASAIGRLGAAAAQAGRCPVLVRLHRERGGDFGAREVFQAAEEGSEVARMIFGRVGRYLGVAIANIVNLLNLHLFVIGGGASPAVQYLEGAILREVRERAFRVPAEGVVIRRALLGNDAGMLGAARLVFQAREQGSLGG